MASAWPVRQTVHTAWANRAQGRSGPTALQQLGVPVVPFWRVDGLGGQCLV
jgi:hypothetical protein